MSKEDNLKPVRSKDEARERGHNGGIKSGESRRRKRDAKSAANLILNLPASDAVAKNLASMGIDCERDYTNMVALMARAYTKAMTGDISAMQFLISMSATSPRAKMEAERHKKEMEGEKATSLVEEWISNIPDTEEVNND